MHPYNKYEPHYGPCSFIGILTPDDINHDDIAVWLTCRDDRADHWAQVIRRMMFHHRIAARVTVV